MTGLSCGITYSRTGACIFGLGPCCFASTGGRNLPTGRQWITQNTDVTGSDDLTSHTHTGLFPFVTSSESSASIRRTEIPGDALTTAVTFNKFNRFSIDRISSKFILCEYLIKF